MVAGTEVATSYVCTSLPHSKEMLCALGQPCELGKWCSTDGEERQRVGERLARDPTGCWQQGVVFLSSALTTDPSCLLLSGEKSENAIDLHFLVLGKKGRAD